MSGNTQDGYEWRVANVMGVPGGSEETYSFEVPLIQEWFGADSGVTKEGDEFEIKKGDTVEIKVNKDAAADQQVRAVRKLGTGRPHQAKAA